MHDWPKVLKWMDLLTGRDHSISWVVSFSLLFLSLSFPVTFLRFWIMSAVAKYAPNLPGYKPHPCRDNNRKKCYFQTINGNKFVAARDDEGEEDQALMTSGSILSLGKSSSTQCFPSSAVDAEVLKFTACVTERSLDSFEAVDRKCSILYYLEDGTIKIVEKSSPNSGSPRGTVLRRGYAKKDNGDNITLDDLEYGEDVVIYGRVYSIVNCSEKTRQYLESLGRTNLPPEGVEADEEHWGETQDSQWSSFRREKNNLKVFMEAKLGNTVNNTGREGFQQYGNMVLKFLCSWDDTQRLYGEVSKFVLCYHLADDTVEIFNEGGKDIFPKLLKRAPLPREFNGSTTSFGENIPEPGESFYHYTDFYIGAVLNVYSRELVIHDADSATREFYEIMESPLGPADLSFQEKPVLEFHREVPPHNGFGSEEDSLKSCVGPLCPSNPPARSNVFENRVLSFFGHLMATDGSYDTNRKFVLSFYMQDRTVKIQEPPVRNSGFVGGLFLSRRRVKRVNGDGYVNEHDFVVGDEIKLLTHTFKIIGANDYTLNWIEEQKKECEEKKE